MAISKRSRCSLFVWQRHLAARTLFASLTVLALASCGTQQAQQSASDEFGEMRKHMVQSQIVAREVSDKRVISAMEQVPRHRFVPLEVQAQSYEDYLCR